MSEAPIETSEIAGQRAPASQAEGSKLVTAAVPAAARAGVEAFAAGGNAFDAAVAAALVETVWLPMKCGLAGDALVLLRRAGGPVETWFAVGAAGSGSSPSDPLEETGPRSVGCPGAPEAYAGLASLGRLGLDRLARAAIRDAQNGVKWLPVAVALTREAAGLLRRWNGALPYLPGGALPAVGQRLVLPGLARLLARFATEGGTLMHGEVGDALVARVQAAGGSMAREDLHRAFLERRPPDVTVLADGTRLLTTPAPSYGAVLAAAIQDLDASGACGAAAEVDAASRARARFDARAEGGTSVVTAADDEGNLVVLVHSNSFPQYGSGLVLEDYDLVLNNRPGRGFAAEVDAEHWNAPAPGRIPATTLQAWMVAPSSGPWREHWGATPGGQNQVAWNLQALQTLLKRGPRAAAESPRWGFTRTGVVVERDLDEAHALATRPQAHLCDEGSLRSVLQIQSVPRRSGPSQAVADPRTGALACAAAS